MRVLLVEDDEQIRELTAAGLRHSGFSVDVAENGEIALDKAAVTDYETVILDRDLPVVHGDDVCRELRDMEVPPRILMLTAFSDVGDRIDGLDLGADDYLSKPFDLGELSARLRALSRRVDSSAPVVLRAADVIVDPAARSVTRSGRSVDLTPKEFGVLHLLIKEAPVVVSAEQLLERVWDENADPFTNAVRVTMTNLRRKLGEPSIIETRVGFGYCIRSDG